MSSPNPTNDPAVWEKRLERERRARKEAESLLDEKSLELYRANEKLQELADDLESRVEERTRELEAAVKTARKANRAKSDFLAVMSHEIRTPMNAVLGFAELLEETELNDTQKGHLARILRSGASLLALIDDILDFSKIESGKLQIESRPFSPAACVRESCDLFAKQAAERGLAIRCECSDNLPSVALGDPHRLRQVLSNLIGNAIKFTSAGTVAVHAAAAPGETSEAPLLLQFEVTDTGIGISAEDVGKLFKPFTQIDSSARRRFGGTGLGLVICKRLVKRMNGEIRVASEPGKGSTFHFTISVLPGGDESGATRDATASRPADPANPSRSLHLLAVEDNATNRELLQAMLERLGHTCVFAESGEQIHPLLENDTFDAVLMDIELPDIDGVEAMLRMRREYPNLNELPVVAVTAYADEETSRRCLDAGFDAFLPKPLRKARLHDTLERIVSSLDCT